MINNKSPFDYFFDKTYREDTKKSIQNTIKILTVKCLYHVLPCKGLKKSMGYDFYF